MQISVSGQRTGSWGDQLNGTYINPVLNSDYSDPDVIRVENNIIWYAGISFYGHTSTGIQ